MIHFMPHADRCQGRADNPKYVIGILSRQIKTQDCVLVGRVKHDWQDTDYGVAVVWQEHCDGQEGLFEFCRQGHRLGVEA